MICIARLFRGKGRAEDEDADSRVYISRTEIAYLFRRRIERSFEYQSSTRGSCQWRGVAPLANLSFGEKKKEKRGIDERGSPLRLAALATVARVEACPFHDLPNIRSDLIE